MKPGEAPAAAGTLQASCHVCLRGYMTGHPEQPAVNRPAAAELCYYIYRQHVREERGRMNMRHSFIHAACIHAVRVTLTCMFIPSDPLDLPNRGTFLGTPASPCCSPL